jgi:hypothetical protein
VPDSATGCWRCSKDWQNDATIQSQIVDELNNMETGGRQVMELLDQFVASTSTPGEPEGSGAP